MKEPDSGQPHPEKLCYSYGDGTGRLKRQWFTINGKTYYFNKKGLP